jgi:hypothetical protein
MDDAKRAILARRARFIAAALAGVTATATAIEACGGETTGGDSRSDAAAPRPCLEPPPQPCLGALPPPRDASTDADADAKEEPPKPCLSPIYDGG